MTGPRIGSLFSGYGGLDVGVMAALGGSVAWHVEFDKAPSKILAHHWPDVPNYGDITAVKWAPDCPACGGSMAVYRKRAEGDPYNEFAGQPFYWCPSCKREWDVSVRLDDPEADRIPDPVDVITGGSPCQDLSHAGKRQGMTEGTRSNLWVAMREAIAQLRPGLVVWENVRGAYSAAADSEVEPCAGCVGDRPGVSLRALGRVLGDLSDLGYDCRWHGLRAADVGAPHGRFRVFVVAIDARSLRRGAGWPTVAGEAARGWAPADIAGRGLLSTPRSTRGGSSAETVGLLPTPTTQDGANTGGPSQFDRNSVPLNALVTLLPTPAVNDMGEGKTPETWDEWTAKMQAAHGNGNGHGKSLAIETMRLLPTPVVADSRNSRQSTAPNPRADNDTLCDTVYKGNWGIYADAIARWEALTRPAPEPTQLSESYRKMRAKRAAGLDKRPVGMRGSLQPSPQLSPAFSEWLMGLPEGHVTGVPGLSRNDMLKALGNGVVPQQAAAALRFLLGARAAA